MIKINIDNMCHFCRVLGKHKICKEPCKDWYKILGVKMDYHPVDSNVGYSIANNGAFYCFADGDWSDTGGVRNC